MRRDPLGFLMETTHRYGDSACVRFPPFRMFLFSHPRDVKYILHDNHRNYWKGVVFGKLKRVAGEGLVFSDGELWRRQRQLIQPAFHRTRVAAMAEMMIAKTRAMIEEWDATASSGRPLDVAEEMSRLTLGIVTRALFGTDLGQQDDDEFRRAVTAGMAYANHLLNHLFTPPLVVPTPANLRARRALASLDRIIAEMIAERRRDASEGGDLLSMLIRAVDSDDKRGMDDRQLRDECVTFLVAGHETTAVALSWTWYLLAGHPEVERRLHAEIDAVLGHRAPTMADLDALPYTRMIIEESMRLYPPVWGTNRQAHADDVVGGVRVPAGSTVTISPYVTHRNPGFWEDPERFDPERFTAQRSVDRPEYAYLPFGGGPRRCVGNQFAMLEAQLVLALVAQRFALRCVPGHPVEPHPILTLRPRRGLVMTLERRA
jgi:cytochrome P450